MTSAESAAAVRGRWLAVLLLIGAVAAVFGNALPNQFVYDDRLLVVDNWAVRAPLRDLHALGFYRPLRTLSYRLDYALGGTDPWVFHLTNVAYHAVTVMLVHAALAGSGASPLAALGGALVFAVHPVQADAVTYVSGRRDVLCALFFVAGFCAYLRYRRTRGAGALAVALAGYLLAILAKEMAITLPLVCLAYDRFTRRREATAAGAAAPAGRPAWLVVVGIVLGAGVGWLVYGRFVERVLKVTGWHGGSVGTNFATVLRIWAQYLWLVAWPARLSADYSERAFPVSTSALDPSAIAAAALLVGLGMLAAWRWRRGGLDGFGAVWWAVCLLPVSHLVPYRELMAEHYLYLPMVGVAYVAAGAIDGAARGASRAAGAPAGRRRVAFAGVLVLTLAAGARTAVRNRDWHDSLTLWTATVATFPQCARAHFNLGQAYYERVRFDDAEREWRAAAALAPDDVDVVLGLAALAYRQGKLDEAERWITAALARKPDDGRVQSLAGWIALDGGDAAGALPRFDAAIARLTDPTSRTGRGRRERSAALEGAEAGRERAVTALARAGVAR
jgi:tetratricopeptide (TPR) repeat protein